MRFGGRYQCRFEDRETVLRLPPVKDRVRTQGESEVSPRPYPSLTIKTLGRSPTPTVCVGEGEQWKWCRGAPSSVTGVKHLLVSLRTPYFCDRVERVSRSFTGSFSAETQDQTIFGRPRLLASESSRDGRGLSFDSQSPPRVEEEGGCGGRPQCTVTLPRRGCPHGGGPPTRPSEPSTWNTHRPQTPRPQRVCKSRQCTRMRDVEETSVQSDDPGDRGLTLRTSLRRLRSLPSLRVSGRSSRGDETDRVCSYFRSRNIRSSPRSYPTPVPGNLLCVSRPANSVPEVTVWWT